MKLTAALIRRWMLLAQGETLPAGKMKGNWVEEMLDEGVLISSTRKSRVSYQTKSPAAFLQFLADRYQVKDLEQTLQVIRTETTRSQLVHVSGDSKWKRRRTMKGFMVTSLTPIDAELNHRPFTIHPPEGSFVYVYDYEGFRVPEDVLIIGVENAENFRYLSFQKSLFPERRILFVSRYPLSGDFPKWLATVSNEYLHFGDFDLAGIHIFLTEIYQVVGRRAMFYIPENIEQLLQNGSSTRYEHQLKYSKMDIPDERLQHLVDLIHKYRKGYDQEGLIERMP